MNPSAIGSGSTNYATNGWKPTAEDIVNRHETPETKLLSNEQLQRIVLLQQANVLQLKRMKLERELRMKPNENNNDYELLDWDARMNTASFAQ